MLGGQFELGELGHPLYQLGDLVTEQLLHLGAGDDGVLDQVMQQGSDDGRRDEPVVGEDARHLDGVGEVGIAGGPLLGAVHSHRIDVGAVEQPFVGGGVVGADPLDQLVLTQELGPARWRAAPGGRVFGNGGGLRRRDGEGFCAFGAQYRSS